MTEIENQISGDTQPSTIWSGSASDASARTSLLNSSWSQGRATILSNATSVTLGDNPKVSGSCDIKGRDDSCMLPHTQALHAPPVKIENRTNSEFLDVRFGIDDTEYSTEAFQAHIMAILQIDNDGGGLRTGDQVAAR